MQYAVAAFNGAGVAINDDFEDGWRTIEVYRATFYYNFPVDLRFSPTSRVSPYIEACGSLSEELRTETEMLGALDTKGRYEFKGWKTRPTDILNVVSRNFDGSWAIPSITINCDLEYYADWVAKQTNGMTQNWLDGYQTISTASNGDIARAAAMTAANGCRTVGECYALGIDPEDPDDDLRITHFQMEGGKPQIMLNHTTDGSGESFEPRMKTLGKTNLEDAEWREVPEEGDPSLRFFKVEVEMP